MAESQEAIEPRTRFDWGIYADATFAGLSVLIPIPLLDLLFETIFKRRMAQTIAKRNGRLLEKPVVQTLNQGRFGCWPGCFMWPINLTLEFLKRLYRTILYFLTIKAASDQLSFYWHRAFLLDYMVRRGDLNDVPSAPMAAAALDTTLRGLTTSPLQQLAQQIIGRVSHVLRTVWRWLRREKEDEVVIEARHEMEASWGLFSDYFLDVARQYEAKFEMLEAERLSQLVQVLPEAPDSAT